jgi:hypothetical protein
MKALSEHRGDSEELHRMFGRSKQRMCDSSQQSVRSSKQMLYVSDPSVEILYSWNWLNGCNFLLQGCD